MCTNPALSKYQKRVIKFLYDFLGNEYPFYYEKAQNNHLKILIDGVPKPMFTASTPSDIKAFNNFKSDIKREIKRLQEQELIDHCVQVDSDESLSEKKKQAQLKEVYKRLIMTCVKNIRVRIETLKSREEEFVFENRSLESLKDFRINNIRLVISQAIQSRKAGEYIKSRDKRTIEQEVMRHFDFLMPSMAYYADYLDSKTKFETVHMDDKQVVGSDCQDGSAAVIEDIEPDERVSFEKITHLKAKKSASAKVAGMTSISHDLHAEPHASSGINQETGLDKNLVAMMHSSSSQRISQFRELNKAQMMSLIDELNQAMALNRERDINEVISLIKEKDIPIEVIISRLGEH